MRYLGWFVVVTIWLADIQQLPAQNLLDRLERVLRQPSETQPLPAPTLQPSSPTQPPAVTPPAFVPTGRRSLGVTVDVVTEATIHERNLPVRRGALITGIVQGSPADQAGLPLGAVIVAVDGQRVDSPSDLVEAIRASRTDRPLEFSYYQGERLVRKSIPLAVEGAQPPVEPRREVRRETLRQPGEVARPPAGPSREQQLGEPGRRPILGRVARIIDDLVAPAGAELPLQPDVPPPPEDGEVEALREQVATLQQELATMQKRLAELESLLEQQNER